MISAKKEEHVTISRVETRVEICTPDLVYKVVKSRKYIEWQFWINSYCILERCQSGRAAAHHATWLRYNEKLLSRLSLCAALGRI